ncbi:hypothetical protein OG698_10005 [Streptomyces sp. NBC_01003]|uniref:hypothetical protein n=1 Tax=Streptomyces sp. NBC_01003 TaxID=2903714 RepID=UPI00386371D0|nr:hypothetical protein OG698_10005 [Streptomyces sp. NBC_01003]
MIDYDAYGTSAHTPTALIRLISTSFGVQFVERESDYRGVYHVAQAGCGRIEIQPNTIPGDDHSVDLYAPEHPMVGTLLFTITKTPDDEMRDRLSNVDGLVLLDRETV